MAVTVSKSEDELIKLARGLVGSGRPPPRARATVALSRMSPSAMGLLQQTLARGVAADLLRGGGWETRQTLVEGRPRRGRLWERHRELPPLRFGPASMELLLWLHEEDLVRPSRVLERRSDTTLADEILHYLACEQLVGARLDIHQPAFLLSPLCQLGFFGFLAREDQALPDIDFGPLVSGPGAIVVEALQSSLASRWVAAERHKGSVVTPQEMIRIGCAQEQVLDAWFDALDRVEPRRRELAGFIAEAARRVLGSNRQILTGPDAVRRLREATGTPDHRWWIRSLTVSVPLSIRQQAFTAAAAFVRGVVRLGGWLDEAGLVPHFDEDYEAAQMLLSTWHFLRVRPPQIETPLIHGPAPAPASILERAAMIARTLESLHSLGAAPPAAPPEFS